MALLPSRAHFGAVIYKKSGSDYIRCDAPKDSVIRLVDGTRSRPSLVVVSDHSAWKHQVRSTPIYWWSKLEFYVLNPVPAQ